MRSRLANRSSLRRSPRACKTPASRRADSFQGGPLRPNTDTAIAWNSSMLTVTWGHHVFFQLGLELSSQVGRALPAHLGISEMGKATLPSARTLTRDDIASCSNTRMLTVSPLLMRYSSDELPTPWESGARSPR